MTLWNLIHDKLTERGKLQPVLGLNPVKVTKIYKKKMHAYTNIIPYIDAQKKKALPRSRVYQS
jgi:hypothetical protein